MKKTSINLLCVLIIVTIGLSLVMPVYYIGYSFGYGFAESIKNDNPLITESTIPMKGYDMAFNPDIELFLHPVDSVRAADGVTYPAVIQRAEVFVPADTYMTVSSVGTLILNILSMLMGITVLIAFIKFVYNINKEHIFEHKNVRLLRLLGTLLIFMALCSTASGLLDDHILSRIGFELQGYSVSTYWTIPWTTLIIGLAALLMAQVWARGIDLKEEQALTI
ncbi:MAG: DUF2975 domain-containing protein [Muribaculaceae bacterium]|nr:DUF2975 domain-containing protein [Muribaculaceae bacterium]MDE7189007.1 DUF2975 domain-containing protein [Muribaculaceae bacterium]